MPDDGSTQGEPPQEPESQDGGKTFDQEDVNRIVQERLARERAKYDDYDDLREKAEQFEEMQEARKTELEKAQERAAKLEKENAAYERELAEERTRRTIMDAASKAGARDPDAVYRLLDTDVLERDEDGSITNADEAVQTLLEERDYLQAGQQQAGSVDQGIRGGPSQEPGDQMNSWLRQAAGRAP